MQKINISTNDIKPNRERRNFQITQKSLNRFVFCITSSRFWRHILFSEMEKWWISSVYFIVIFTFRLSIDWRDKNTWKKWIAYPEEWNYKNISVNSCRKLFIPLSLGDKVSSGNFFFAQNEKRQFQVTWHWFIWRNYT